MNNLMKAEWFKLTKDRSFRMLPWMLVFLAALLTYFSIDNSGIAVFDSSRFYHTDVMSFNNEMLKLVPCILAGFFISSEYAVGTMKSIAASGNIRLRLYLAKLFTFSIGAVFFALIFPVVTMGVSGLLTGFQRMPEWDFFVQTIALYALYTAAFASIMTVFATIFTDSGKSIGFLLMLFFFFDELLNMLASKFSFLEPLWNYSVFKLLLNVSKIQTLDNGEWFALVAVPILTFAAFGLLGIWVFQRKEIK